MKTVLSVVCSLGVLVMLAACDNGDSSSGDRGDFADVSFVKQTVNGEEIVTCYNADNNVRTTNQVCTWNCAYYHSSEPRWVQLTFDEALICNPTGEEDEDGNAVQECNLEMALVGEKFGACVL
jgi:hypothetical protein